MDRNVNLRVVDGSKSVALRKESVDRNKIGIATIDSIIKSLSARRAWIEIPHTSHDFRAPKVALRKESVDRNIWVNKTQSAPSSRSPQGERG